MIVFLSHSTRDKEFALKLDDGLRRSGFQPWLCEIDIAQGSNWVQRMEDGLRGADIVLLLWSPDAAASEATAREWTAALAREISDCRLRLGVIMLRQHPLPELLRTKQYIDATGNRDEAVGRVAQWLHDRREAGRGAGGNPVPIFLPDYRPKNFVGRNEHLQKMRAALVEQEDRLLLHGEPGSGKSTLALEFSWQAQKDFDAVVFQLCGQRSAKDVTGALAEQLKGDLGEEVTRLPLERKLELAKDWMKRRRTLLVLDDVWLDGSVGQTPEGVRSLIPGPPVSVLFTSRWRGLPGLVPGQMVAVESFTEAEAEQVFASYLGADTVARHRQALLDFAERVERLPMAVGVGAQMLSSQFDPLDEAANSLVLENLRNEVHDVPGLFQKAIQSQGEDERKLLEAASVCSSEGFWLPLAAEIAGLTREQAAKARDHLVNGSLMRLQNQDRRRFQMHNLLREQARAGLAREKLSGLQQAHAAGLERLFEEWESRSQECRECLEEVVPATAFLSNSGPTLRASGLMERGFSCARRVGELDVALRMLKKLEELWGGNNASDSFETKDFLQRLYGNQASILHLRGQLEEALELHKREEAIAFELGDKVQLQASYGNQGLLLQYLGRLEEALELHKKEETIALELGDKDQLQRSYGNQALILKAWGLPDEALELHRKEEAIAVEVGDKDQLQRSYGNQALILKGWGRVEEALTLLKKQEIICRELGNKISLQRSYNNQALILADKGCLEDALVLFKQQEAICLEVGIKRDLGYCYWGWGYLARKQGDHSSARQKLHAALAIFTDMKMPHERDGVKQELDNTPGQADAAGN